MISRLLFPSAVRLATYSCVRRSRLMRAKQIMYSAQLASRLPPRLKRCLTTLPEEASMGETPQRRAKEASLLNLLGLSLRPRSTASRRLVGADACQRDQLRSNLRHQPIEVRVRLGDLFREGLVTAGHRTERELGRSRYVARIICESEARGDRDELLRAEPAQKRSRGVRQVPSDASLAAGWRPLGPGLDGGAAGRAQGPNHLHLAVGALGHARRFSGQDRSCSTLGLGRSALLEVAPRASLPMLRALHLQHLDPPGPQVADELKAP